MSSGLVLYRCTAHQGSQLWSRLPSGEICVHGSPDQCLHYDPTALGVNVAEPAANRSQYWSTIESGQLQLTGTNICLGLVGKSNSRFLVAGLACSDMTTLTIAFGHASAAKLFRPLGFQRLHAITSMRHRAAPPAGGSKYELNDHLSRSSEFGTHVVLKVESSSSDSPGCVDRVSSNDLWTCMHFAVECLFLSLQCISLDRWHIAYDTPYSLSIFLIDSISCH